MLALIVPQRTLYDYRGIDGTGTASNPASGSNIRSYTIRKLADGNCWMAENLKLTLTSGRSIKVGTFAGGETSWTPTSGSGNASNVAINANTKSNTNGGNWYYSWHAAVAATSNTSTSYTATQSICPKGWKIPANSGDSSFANLVTTTYNISSVSTMESSPLSFTSVGVYSQSGTLNTAFDFYWTSTSYSSSYAYTLFFMGSTIDTHHTQSGKTDGFPVRCVAIP